MVGCSTKPNPKSCLDNHCSDPSLPFCDVDGSIGGEPNTCIAVECTPNEFEACRGDRALTCNAAGDNFDLIDCEFGCGESGCKPCDRPECEKHIVPRYIPNVCSTLATTPSLVVGADVSLDTSSALACTNVVTQATGPEICVLHYDTITIERNVTYSVTGTRALALVADHALVVDGVLDVSANGSTSGPGGGIIKSGSGAEVAGGGGAGARVAGAGGGNASTDGGAANGGTAATHPSSLTELFGGAQPARTTNNAPGGGGGAVTLISCRGLLSVPGVIDAGGGGGARATLNMTTYRFAAGGGAGGTVVLQGMTVNVTGEIYSNGGGGGAGSAPNGQSGGDGLPSTSRASGGLAAGGTGNGGAGGTSFAPNPGQADAGNMPGAGGGSAGFILTYTPQLVFPTLTPVGVSPGFEPNGNVATN